MNNILEEKYHANRIKELIDDSSSIAVIPSEIAKADSLLAGAGLYYALTQREKDVSLVYMGQIPDEYQKVIEPGQVTNDVYSRKLSISIDYSDTPASKLAYSNENNVLKLILSPVSKDFDLTKIKTEIQGHDFDLIFTLGAQSPEDLGVVGSELHDSFAKAKIVNIDNTNMNTQYGSINVVDTSASNLSTIVFNLLSLSGILPDTKSAKALLLGMTYRETWR